MGMEIVADPVPMAMDKNGIVRIAGTRVTLDTIVGAYNRGDTPEEIFEGFPTISMADIHAVIAYYLHHQEDVDSYLAENDRRADEARALYEAKFGKQPTRAELEARRVQRQHR